MHGIRHTVRPPPLRRLCCVQAELRTLEQQHRVYDLYCWLAQRMPRAFTAGVHAQALRAQCAELIRQVGSAAHARSTPHCARASLHNAALVMTA